MTESCEGNNAKENRFQGCQCHDAERRIANNEINCGYDLCPQDCEVCKSCLYYVIDDCMEMDEPTRTPVQVPSPPPTVTAPSPPPVPVIPTDRPTPKQEQFDIMQCDAYSDNW